MLVTIADYHLAGECHVRCAACRRGSEVDLYALSAKHGWFAKVAELPFRCSRCGKLGQPHWVGRLDALGIRTRGIRLTLKEAGVLEHAERACHAAGIEVRTDYVATLETRAPAATVPPIKPKK